MACWRIERRGDDLAVSFTGRMCGHPASPGCVAPGCIGTFSAVGNLGEVISAYRRWASMPIVSNRGDQYPERGFLGCRAEITILSAFADEFEWDWPTALQLLREVA